MTPGWNTVPIRELYEGLYDGPHATPRPANDGPIFLGIKNVTDDGRLDLSEVRHIAEEDYATWTRRIEPRPGDLVFTYEATLNRYAIIPEGFRGCLGRRMALIRPDPRKADVRFLLYSFFTDAWRAVIKQNTLTGATVDRIPLTTFPEFPIAAPDVDVQRRIADELAAYDELIENCQRRIQILETMAGALYREWFVEFRFPGDDESSRLRNAATDLPDGWSSAELADVCVGPNGIQTGPFGSQLHESDYSDGGVPVVMPRDLIDFRIRMDKIARIPEAKANSLGRHRVMTGDIVYGRRGDIGRRAFVMQRQAGWFCGTGCLRIRPNEQAINGWYLFNYLGQANIVALIAGRAQGVTMPNLNTGVMATVPVVVPPRELQDRYALLSLPLAEASEVLHATMANLRTTRDLLLPRLLSGQLALAETEAAVP